MSALVVIVVIIVVVAHKFLLLPTDNTITFGSWTSHLGHGTTGTYCCHCHHRRHRHQHHHPVEYQTKTNKRVSQQAMLLAGTAAAAAIAAAAIQANGHVRPFSFFKNISFVEASYFDTNCTVARKKEKKERKYGIG